MSERTDEEELTVEADNTDSDGANSTGADERAAERGAVTDTAGGQFERAEDRAAERFLELEAELSAGADATLPDGTVRPGHVRDAALVDASEIPEGYPVDVGTGRALALTVALEGGRTVRTYLDWPEGGDPAEESTLGRLLAGLDIAPGQLAELYGRQVLVEVVDGRYTLYLPENPPRGTGRDVYGLVASLVASVAALVGLSLGAPGPLFLTFLFLTVFVVPLFTYRDGWYLRTHSDWEGGPVFWATLAAIPGLNLISTALYLLQRNRATFL